MITERVARFIVNTSEEIIPPEAFEIARLATIDLIGVALLGSAEKSGEIIAGYAREMNCAPVAGVIGKGFKTSTVLAAQANGVIGHALDYDDISFVYNAHPSTTLVPVILSLGESLGISGKEVLTAYIIGFEAGSYISSPVANHHYRQGWHSTGTSGVMGATAAAAKLLKLDVLQTRMALGIGASMACGLRQNFGTMTKPLHAGNAAANGITAALLARRGFTAHESVIESPAGYAKALGCEDKIDWEKASEGLGKTFVTTRSAIGFKPYPSCGGTLGIIDSVIYLRDKYKINPSDIESIILGVGPFENGTLIHNPTKGLEGKFSMEYCASRAILAGNIELHDFTDEQVNQPEIRSLMQLTKCIEKYPRATMGVGASGMNPQSVTIKMKNGEEYFRETPMEGGMAMSPMTVQQIERKYQDCASVTLDQAGINESLSLLRGLKSLKNISRLMQVVAKL